MDGRLRYFEFDNNNGALTLDITKSLTDVQKCALLTVDAAGKGEYIK